MLDLHISSKCVGKLANACSCVKYLSTFASVLIIVLQDVIADYKIHGLIGCKGAIIGLKCLHVYCCPGYVLMMLIIQVGDQYPLQNYDTNLDTYALKIAI